MKDATVYITIFSLLVFIICSFTIYEYNRLIYARIINHIQLVILNILMNTVLRKRKRNKAWTDLMVYGGYFGTAKCRTQSLPYYEAHLKCFLAFKNVIYFSWKHYSVGNAALTMVFYKHIARLHVCWLRLQRHKIIPACGT